MLELKFTSPIDKFLSCHTMKDVKDYAPYPIFSGETFAVHAVFCDTDAFLKTGVTLTLSADCGKARLYRIDTVPVRVPCYPTWNDDDYMSKEPGVYPDIMTEINEDTLLFAPQRGLTMLRIELPDLCPGEHNLSLTLCTKDEEVSQSVTEKLDFKVLEAAIPHQKTCVMQILHADCIAEYYGVPALSDEHFGLLRRWVRTAVENGINALYTPVFTPPLDTRVGGERLTVQLVDVFFENGSWHFGFEKLDRWCDMALAEGVEYFEISHLFTQWGAYHAPKVMASVNGEQKRVFGWETDSGSAEYITFLRSFLEAFLEHMRERGLDQRCIFHISDEPSDEQEESYRSATEAVSDLLDGYIVADALSDVKFYTKGICKKPIPGTDHAGDFLRHIPEGLWVYYCCSQSSEVSNRYIAMPLSRVRVIGFQMWKARCTGFLHWGFNFYKSQYSRYSVDPYTVTDGDYFAPAGDAFSVYPGENGDAVPSLRLRAFYEALCDIRALEAAEARYGREAVLRVVDEGIDGGLAFDRYLPGREYIENVRRRIGEMMS